MKRGFTIIIIAGKVSTPALLEVVGLNQIKEVAAYFIGIKLK